MPCSGQYSGVLASGVCCWRSGTGDSALGSVPALMLTSAVVAPEPSVSPKPFSVRTLPRSTVTLPVHSVEHHCVVASPSMALDAGDPSACVDAVAVPASATLSAVVYGAAAWPS